MGCVAYRAVGYPLVCGFSRQPLLDACRQLKSLYGLTGERAGLIPRGTGHPGYLVPGGSGRGVDVKEPDKGAIRFGEYVDLAAVFRGAGAEAA